MCLEPNGDVLACQSYYQPLGNLLNNTWDSIWNHPLAQSLRERKLLAEKCSGCALLPACGGGCPLMIVPAESPQLAIAEVGSESA
jgi:radical SAM protein with 4Fe4S-binding SPASM domain